MMCDIRFPTCDAHAGRFLRSVSCRFGEFANLAERGLERVITRLQRVDEFSDNQIDDVHKAINVMRVRIPNDVVTVVDQVG
jgi:hypothetical protein